MNETRLRKSCPACGSLLINRRRDIHDYKCKSCGHCFKTPHMKPKMCTKTRIHKNMAQTPERLTAIREYYNNHPGITQENLICECKETKYMVEKMFKIMRNCNN
jgi:DNA-directed RNA polymerase subunit M/transcription elongation factor TFIIS